jgi:conflict system pore-forming effector with SLATT domain
VAGTPTRNSKDGPRAAPSPKPAPPKATWDDQLEELLRSWHRRVAAAEAGHRVMADRMRRRYLMLGVPVVILTTIVGTSVFASIQDAKVATWIRVVVGSVSLLAAVISSLQTFLRYGMRAEGHRVAAIRYETLRRDMAAVLAIPRASRTEPIRQLDGVRNRMDRYAKESPTIGEREWNRLERTFHLSKVPPDPSWAGRTVHLPDSEDAALMGDSAEGGTDGR